MQLYAHSSNFNGCPEAEKDDIGPDRHWLSLPSPRSPFVSSVHGTVGMTILGNESDLP